jgi:hypothetical protein
VSSGLTKESKIILKASRQLKFIYELISNLKSVCKISVYSLLYHRLKI